MDWTSSLASGGETTGTRSVSYHSSVVEEHFSWACSSGG
jgi:hypothetical protein